MANTPRLNVGYGLSEALPSIFPSPIIAKRSPTVNDTGFQIGQIWVFNPHAYILVGVASGIATWNLLEASGGAGLFTTLRSTGATVLATTGQSVNVFGNTTGATSLELLAGTGGIVTAGIAGVAVGNLNVVTIDTVTGQLGSQAASGGSPFTTLASTGATTLATTGASVNTFGNTTGATSVEILAGSGGILTAGVAGVVVGNLNVVTIDTVTGQLGSQASSGGSPFTTLTSTGATTLATTADSANTFGNTTGATSVGIMSGTGDVTITSPNVFATGDISLTTAGSWLSLPGPVNIQSGAGAPAAGLIRQAGDMYINTVPTVATDRLYIAIDGATWTNISCAA